MSNMEVEVRKININTEVDSNITINFTLKAKETRDIHIKTLKLSMMIIINCIIMIVEIIMMIKTCICINNNNNSNMLHHLDREKRLYILEACHQGDYFHKMLVLFGEHKAMWVTINKA